MKKLCPMSFNADWGMKHCRGSECAWWNEWLGICGVITEGWLRGLTISRDETKVEAL